MGNQNCNCLKLDFFKFCSDEKNVISLPGINTFENLPINEVILIQAIIRAYLFRKRLKQEFLKITKENTGEPHIFCSESKPSEQGKDLENFPGKKKKKKHNTKSKNRNNFMDTPNLAFDEEKCPGIFINFENISVHPKVAETEKLLGAFVMEEKELLRYIENYEYKLKQYQIEYPDGKIYNGYFGPAWTKEGYGVLIFKDGSKYIGTFRNNLTWGRGRLITFQGDYYEGEFANDKANGYGKYVNKEGGIYLGYWTNDKKDGKGEEILPDGSRYEGFYEMGIRQGKGKFTWTDASVYDGDFVNNLFEGYGIYRWRDGRVYQGEWKNNKMEGTGIFIWPDNKKYIGEYKDDKKSGFGMFIWPGGKKYEGEWANGKQHGVGLLILGQTKNLGLWKNGQKIKWLKENEHSESINRIVTGIKIITERINSNSFFLVNKTFDSSPCASVNSIK